MRTERVLPSPLSVPSYATYLATLPPSSPPAMARNRIILLPMLLLAWMARCCCFTTSVAWRGPYAAWRGGILGITASMNHDDGVSPWTSTVQAQSDVRVKVCCVVPCVHCVYHSCCASYFLRQGVFRPLRLSPRGQHSKVCVVGRRNDKMLMA